MSNQRMSSGCAMVFAVGVASCVALVGAYIVLISVNVIPVDPSSFHAPRLVVASAGMVFLLLGGWMAFRAVSPYAQDTRLYQWMQSLLFLGALVAFLVVFLWIGLGPGSLALHFFGVGCAVLLGIGALTFALRRVRRLLARDGPADAATKEPLASGREQERQG